VTRMGITASRAQPWLRGFLGEGRTALRITATSFRARAQYRGDFITALAMGLAWQTSVLVFATVILTRFPGLGGWTPAASC
jgi:ABC-2 type transport system permease protein